MPNVPRRSVTRNSHGSISRASHRDDGFQRPLRGYEDVYRQIGVDGTVGPGDIPPGTIDGDGAITPSSIGTLTPFADTIRPVAVVAALPPLPDASYPDGATVVLTTDGKLYRNFSGSWTAAVPTGDLSGTITTTQIDDGAISTPKLAANAVTAAKIAAGTITATEIASDTITAGQIAAGAIGVSEIAAGAVSAEKMTVGAKASFNDVRNPSFEDVYAAGEGPGLGHPRGWDEAFEIGGAGASFSNTVTTAGTIGSGSRSFRLSVAATTDGSSIASKSFPVAPGDKYYLSAWAKATAAVTDGFYLRLKFGTSEDFPNTGSTNVDAVTDGPLTTTLAQYQGYVTVPAGKTWARVLLYNFQPNVATDFFFDDVICYRVASGLKNSDGNVVIDSSGITITDGKLSFADQFGAVAMNGYGFGESWTRFIRNGFYNGDFANGSTSDLAVTETGSGTPLANYQASLSASLPSWVVSASGGVIKLIADAAATAGLALQSTATAGAQTNRVYQDIPVEPGLAYRTFLSSRWTVTADTASIRIYFSWRTSTHAIIGARTLASTFTASATVASYGRYESDTNVLANPYAPANASFLRVEIEVVHNVSAGQTVWISDISADSVFLYDGNQTITSLTLTAVDQNALSLTLAPGRYLITGFLNMTMSATGGGDVTVAAWLDGVQYPTAIWNPPTATVEAPIPFTVYLNVAVGAAGAFTIKCKKAVAAGTVTLAGGFSNAVVVGLK